jgi:hypothetical protein
VNLVILTNIGLLTATLCSALIMIDHMNRGTRGAVRWGATLLLAGAVAEGFGYFWHWANWTDTLFFGGVAMVTVANLRFPAGVCTPGDEKQAQAERERAKRKADTYAYAVGVLTLMGLAAAWLVS